MDVLFINPAYSLVERYGKTLARFGGVCEPLGLAYLASVLEEVGVDVRIIDAAVEPEKLEELCRSKIKKYSLIGVTMLTPMYGSAVATINKIAQAGLVGKIVTGGPHPTALPINTLAEIGSLHYAVIGEGERTIRELIDVIEMKGEPDEVRGLVFKGKGGIQINEPRELIEDLDELPFPARHLLPMDRYKITRSRSRQMHSYTVIIGRGCPFRCTFCANPFGRKFRRHSHGRILSEIELLIKKYGAQEINLEADNLTVDKEFVKELCHFIISAGYHEKVRWTCESRVDSVDREILQCMKEAGCWQISYGVESGVQRLLDVIRKDITLEQIEDAFRITEEVGISIRAFYMLGLPTETVKESLQTIRFAKKLDSMWAQFTIAIPYPGTKFFSVARENGELRTTDWTNYNTWGGWTNATLPYVPRGRTEEELRTLQKKAMRMYYMRPKMIWQFLKKINSLNAVKDLLSGGVTLIRSMFR